ncbi:MAG: RNA methyltransferase [Anaerovoracaceae bacterium]
MKIIKSGENQQFKMANKLTTRKYRDSFGKYLVEGEKFVKDAFAAGQDVECVFFVEGYDQIQEFPSDKLICLDKKLFVRLSQTETSQGIIAVVRKKEMNIRLFSEEIKKQSGNIVVLDRLQDPGNIGTIIRTADAAGYRGIITLQGTGDVYSPKVVRSAAGSIFRVPILGFSNWQEAIDLLKSENKTIITTAFNTENYYYNVDMKKDIALIIGNEGQGVSEELTEAADIKVKIPMEGTIDSLNAAVAAGVIMYESVRK